MNTKALYPIKSEFASGDDLPTIVANDSLNLVNFQQARRKLSRVHNQRRNTGRIIWNDETKQVEIRDNSSIRKTFNEASNDKNVQQSSMNNCHSLTSRFENNTKESINSPSRINRLQNQESSKKPLTITKSLLVNEINLKKDNDDLIMIKLYEDTKKIIDQLNEKVDWLEKDLDKRDQIIENLKTSQYFESSFDKREKRVYEQKISELGEELKKIDLIKADNIRLKEENAALIREKRVYEQKISELGEELKKIDLIKADNIRLKEENAALIRVISKLSK
ncbi:unnamed protein product [Rotaria sordida]|uniref:cGMP-dependent protein kinase interacting domain-containing protein n=1 Tax=Rotaria sordida TaxID=392033 RepID=A0A814AP03_9BILA|nr:unnamed protein product [Rotaria sordida]